VPEPLYQANLAAVRATLPSAPFNIAIISFTELEQLVAETLREGSGRVLDAAKPASPVMMADVLGALSAAQRRAGGSPATNPLLDTSFEALIGT
jgi:hypothetical protein